MFFRHYFFFIFFTLLFLFYPGDSWYFTIFAYNRPLFQKKEIPVALKTNPIPILKYQYYPEISAEGVYVVDIPSFTPVFKRNETEKFLPASTVKIITALVAFDVYKPDQIIQIKNVKPNGQTMGLVTDERITVENLLYGLLVQSGNDSAFALAEHYGYETFINRMNEKARQIGMKNSTFKNPAGLDERDQLVSPYDMALAARILLNNPYLSKIVSTKEIIILDEDFRYSHKLTNVNKLLGEIQGIGGLKTGYTENAGENLVSFYKKNNHQFIIVILKSLDRFTDTKQIVTWIDENVEYYSMK